MDRAKRGRGKSLDLLVLEAFAHTYLCREVGQEKARSVGMPPMGAFDPWCTWIASELCGRFPATVVETASRLTVKAMRSGCLVVVGAGTSVDIDGRVIQSPCRVSLPEGQNVVVGAPTQGQRTVLATPSGWLAPVPFGAANCQPVVSGSKLVGFDEGSGCKDLRLDPSALLAGKMLRVVGEQSLPEDWTVQADSDRRGVRLVSDQLVEGPPGLAVSRPCFTGTCQLTPNGTLIVHGPDGPTIGGYAQVGQLIEADRKVLAQLRPGDEVTIKRVTMEVALEALLLHREEEHRWRRQIQIATR